MQHSKTMHAPACCASACAPTKAINLDTDDMGPIPDTRALSILLNLSPIADPLLPLFLPPSIHSPSFFSFLSFFSHHLGSGAGSRGRYVARKVYILDDKKRVQFIPPTVDLNPNLKPYVQRDVYRIKVPAPNPETFLKLMESRWKMENGVAGLTGGAEVVENGSATDLKQRLGKDAHDPEVVERAHIADDQLDVYKS
jgi:hypothetical protein